MADKNLKYLIAEWNIRQTNEWTLFIRSTEYMRSKYFEFKNHSSNPVWITLTRKFERNVIEPLERKWQEVKR